MNKGNKWAGAAERRLNDGVEEGVDALDVQRAAAAAQVYATLAVAEEIAVLTDQIQSLQSVLADAIDQLGLRHGQMTESIGRVIQRRP